MPKLPSRVAAWSDRKTVSQALKPSGGRPHQSPGRTSERQNHRISRLAQLTVVEESILDYDQGLGLYCLWDEPFTGVATEYQKGELRSLVHYVRGLAHGIAVVWHPNGQIKLFNEVAHDVRNGLYIEWAEDGTLLTEEHYSNGRKVSANPKKPKRKK